MVRVILLETLLVALGGSAVWGLAWELGFPNVGLALAVVIWVIVSPAIEIATVLRFRQGTWPGSEASAVGQ